MLKRLFVSLLICSVFMQCARRGSPTGGPEDETPPVVLRADPPQRNVNFKQDRVRIYFDEYIKLEKINEQLVVSPPLEQTAYVISPQSQAAKYIEIAFLDSLAPNTTYTFNFGESVIDNNEGNPFSFFSYVFSSGPAIDSLTVRGTISDAIARSPESFVSVMLYPVDSTFTDSVIYKNKPLYYTNTLDSLIEFSIPNLKAGAYLLAAVKDVSKNYVFDPSVDKVDAIQHVITLPNDSLFQLSLFKEELAFDFGKAYQAGEQRVGFGYKGNDAITIELNEQVGDSFTSVVSRDKEADTLYYWYKGIDTDSLRFTLRHDTMSMDYAFRVRKAAPDSLQVSYEPRGTLDLTDTLKLIANTPIKQYMQDFMSLRAKDSTLVPFTISQKGMHELHVMFDVFPNEKYQLELLPGTVTDFFDVSNDSLSVSLNTKSRVDYGNLSLRLGNVPSYPIFIDITNEKEEIIRSKYIKEERGLYRFAYLQPSKYYVRIRVDENANGKWDTGNYLEGKKPEAVYHFPPLLDVRANWELQEQFMLE
ncbi:MAG: Uncharacterised protein [Flavobacteriales bacterium]|nr:MAG: Uncharacterised protein [Flavobacteriales bacterium]